jgi:sulfur carrier protein ThiS
MMQQQQSVLVRLVGDGGEHELSMEEGATVREALLSVNLLPSLHIVSHDAQVLPMTTALQGDVTLEVTRIASGG